MKKLNSGISILKFIYSLMIVIMHWSWVVPHEDGQYLFGGAYLFVDFFFILQGYYLDRRNSDGTLSNNFNPGEYLRGRFQRFFPIVFLVVLWTMFLKIKIVIQNGMEIVWGGIFHMLFISQLVPYELTEEMGISNLLWFLSASVIAGMVLVLIIDQCHKDLYVILPIISFVLYTNLIHDFGHLDTWHECMWGGRQEF